MGLTALVQRPVHPGNVDFPQAASYLNDLSREDLVDCVFPFPLVDHHNCPR